MKTRVTLLLAALLLTACSVGMSYDPSASPQTSWDQRYCELHGGYWNRTAGVCESPMY